MAIAYSFQHRRHSRWKLLGSLRTLVRTHVLLYDNQTLQKEEHTIVTKYGLGSVGVCIFVTHVLSKIAVMGKSAQKFQIVRSDHGNTILNSQNFIVDGNVPRVAKSLSPL